MKTLSRSSFEMEIPDTACGPNQSVSCPPTALELALSEETPREGWNETEPCDGVAPNLVGISETMLWSLHNRASEANDRMVSTVDAESFRIQSAINYDFDRHFGDPIGSLAARAGQIDRVLRLWLKDHPDGWVVSLGEGLETKSRRVDNFGCGGCRLTYRSRSACGERFLAPSDRFFHIGANRVNPVSMGSESTPRATFLSLPRDC